MDTGTLVGTVAIVTSIGTVVYGILNRGHIKSKCCGKTFEASIEIDRNVDTPPIVAQPQPPPPISIREIKIEDS